jgi:hypothetical protein
MNKNMANAMDSIPQTSMNFFPGAGRLTFRFSRGLSSGFSRMVFFGLYVFWDIPEWLIVANVKNGWRIRIIILSFFLNSLSTTVLSQIPTIPTRLELRTWIASKPGLPQIKSFHNPNLAWSAARKSLSLWQDEGYPFASFYFDSIAYAGKSARVNGTIDPGPLILNGPLILHGDTGLRNELLCKWIGFRKDQPFSLALAERVPSLTRSMPFAEETGPAEIEWFGNQAILHLHLKRSAGNSFNGILGLLPGQESTGKMLLTGNIEAGFSNLFNRGIGLDIRWSRFAASSQTAILDARLPALGYSGLGVHANFDLFRQDTLYFRQKALAEIFQSMGGLWRFRFGLQAMSASARQSKSQTFSQSSNSLVFGFEMETGPLHRLNPERAFFSFLLLPGLKKIQDANSSGNLRQIEFRAQGSFPLWVPVNRFIVKGGMDLGHVSSPKLTIADQFRLGGLRSIRGFNENFFFTSSHALVSVQPQIVLDSKFIFSAFCDAMVYNTGLKPIDLLNWSNALGFGMGAEFEAGENLIQVSVANGFSTSSPIDFKASKIHFGYVARF